MSKLFAQKELAVLQNNPDFLIAHEATVENFRRSGLLNFLRAVARPFIYDGGENVQRSAAEAQFNAGYHAALDDILYFKEMYLSESSKKAARMDFGGRRLALSKGDLLDGDVK